MIDKIVHDFINKCIIEIKKENNKELVETHIINPWIKHFTNKIYPYVSLVFIMYCINIILIIIIILLIMKNKNV
jgi:hypothetical protein